MEDIYKNGIGNLTPEALKPSRSTNRHKYSLLPPILCGRDRDVTDGIQTFIQSELGVLKLEDGKKLDASRFAVFSQAFDKLISNVSVYQDVLSDVKREYDECINAIVFGQRDIQSMNSKISCLSNLPATLSGYTKRKEDLSEKLQILSEDNLRLEKELHSIKKINKEQDEDEVKKDVSDVVRPPIEEELRPIPGLSVEQWTDEEALTQYLRQLELESNNISQQQKTEYVHVDKRTAVLKMLDDRNSKRDELLEEDKKVARKTAKLKIALEVFRKYGKNKTSKQELESELLRALHESDDPSQNPASRTASSHSPLDDDPLKEKEAEMILEYIEKFNELFNDGEYHKAAAHAANSPHGVLRTIETIKRFESVSDGMTSPTPLLNFLETLMNSSRAQNHVLDKEMSILACRCALEEDQMSLVQKWLTNGSMTPCDEIGEMLLKTSDNIDEGCGGVNRTSVYMAQNIFSSTGNHYKVCITLYKLQQLDMLLEYAKDVARFSTDSYLRLISECGDKDLVLSFHIPQEEEGQDIEGRQYDMMGYHHHHHHEQPTLPIRLDAGIHALITSHHTEAALELLEDLFKSDGSNITDIRAIIYQESNTNDDQPSKWGEVARFCEDNNMADLSLEIQSAQIVKDVIHQALSVIALDEKDQFNFYT